MHLGAWAGVVRSSGQWRDFVHRVHRPLCDLPFPFQHTPGRGREATLVRRYRSTVLSSSPLSASRRCGIKRCSVQALQAVPSTGNAWCAAQGAGHSPLQRLRAPL